MKNKYPITICLLVSLIILLVAFYSYQQQQTKQCLASAKTTVEQCKLSCQKEYENNQQYCDRDQTINGLKIPSIKTCLSYIDVVNSGCNWRCESPEVSGEAGCVN